MITGTRGLGNTGSIGITARDTVSIDGGMDGLPSSINNIVDGPGIGNGSGINITARLLSITRGGSLASYTNGRGNAGDVNVNAHDTILIDGGMVAESGTYFSSIIFTQVSPVLIDYDGSDVSQRGAVGQGGNVTLSTGSLFLTNGAIIDTGNVNGTGNSGLVTINARDSVQIRGTNSGVA